MSERSKLKAQRRERMLDQVALDKLRGLDDGKICRAYYKALRPKERPPVRKSKAKPRDSASYRGARRNASRASSRALWCKNERRKRHETRPEFDRRREAERREALQ